LTVLSCGILYRCSIHRNLPFLISEIVSRCDLFHWY
jgi:hypothetical protein